MLSATAKLVQDLPPFFIADGTPNYAIGRMVRNYNRARGGRGRWAGGESEVVLPARAGRGEGLLLCSDFDFYKVLVRTSRSEL